MAGAEEERLAPVTYLPGAMPPEGRRAAGRESASIGEFPEDAGSGDDVDEAVTMFGRDFEGDAPDADELRATSVRALTRRSLSRRELERTLRLGGADEIAVETEVRRLEGVGLIDDMALAQNLVAALQERKGLGRSAIAAELARRMVSPAAIAYGLDLVDTGDEMVRARELAIKRAGQLRGLDREVAVRRLSAYLARRGYGGSTVRSAVDAALPRGGAVAGVRFR